MAFYIRVSILNEYKYMSKLCYIAYVLNDSSHNYYYDLFEYKYVNCK